MEMSIQDEYKNACLNIKILNGIIKDAEELKKPYEEKLIRLDPMIDKVSALLDVFENCEPEELTLSELKDGLTKDGNIILNNSDRVTLAFNNDSSVKILAYRTKDGRLCSIKYRDLGNDKVEVLD